MEPSTITLSASAVVFPILAKVLQRLAALQQRFKLGQERKSPDTED
jgi:hypothetical protein